MLRNKELLTRKIKRTVARVAKLSKETSTTCCGSFGLVACHKGGQQTLIFGVRHSKKVEMLKWEIR